jgi:hypothetical protein
MYSLPTTSHLNASQIACRLERLNPFVMAGRHSTSSLTLSGRLFKPGNPILVIDHIERPG